MDANAKAARKKKISHAVMWIVLLLVFIIFVFPFILVIINVFNNKADITMNPMAIIGAHGFTVENFPEAMEKMNFWAVFGNSLIVTVTSTVLTLLVSSMAAFVIVRNNWKACTLLFSGMIASMVIPFQVLMIPLVSLYGGIFNVLNHRITLILMHTGFSVSMAAFGPDRRMFKMADLVEGCLPAAQADRGNRCNHRRDGILERLPPSEPCTWP